MDSLDKKILASLQREARVKNADLARELGVAPSTMLERVRRLEERGYFSGFKAVVNPELLALRENVEEVVQRNLRVILGAQFTEKEGERLINRAFNEKLSTKENARRVKLLLNQIRTAAKAKNEAVNYFEKHGSLTGFKGQEFSKADFSPESLYGEEPEQNDKDILSEADAILEQ